MSGSTMTRKRSRQHLEVDELSPEKEGPKMNTPLASLKRRKLNTYGSSPSTSTTKTKSVFGRLGGLFGFRSSPAKEQENGVEEADDEEKDELGHEGDIWDIAVSDADEEQVNTTAAAVTDVSAPGNGKKRGRKRKVVDDIWEMPGSDLDDQERKVADGRTKGKRTPERLRTVSAPASKTRAGKEGIDSPRRPVGRPRKADILKKEKALSRGAVRKRLSAGNQADLEGEEDAVDTPLSRRSGHSRKSDDAESDNDETQDTIAVKPARRKRGRPRKQEIVDSTKQVPKGILTPTKNGTKKNRKSVAFEERQLAQEDTEVDLGFKDLPKSASKKLSRVPKKPKSSEDSVDDLADPDEPPVKSKKQSAIPKDTPSHEAEIDSDDGDLACAVCGGLDSDEPNEILICDNCDFAVHQECYKVPVVPDNDWFCRDCKPEDGAFEFDLDDEDMLMGSANDLPKIEGFEDHLRGMQRLLLDKLTGQKRIKLRGHDEEMQKVHQIVEQTVLAGEGNSMLVIGARGCGKTTLVESVISDLSVEHRENFHVVRLNGFIHTDDKLALKETWRQLGCEMEIEDELNSKGNYADTLASLLALLSHPSEISDCQSEQTAKSVIFILDEFDLFTTHPRQTLLYNLFDIAQARKAPIVVLGLTTRVDVVESLEKRVKSRFSHRHVHLSLPRSLPAFWETCKEGLSVDMNELEAEGFDPTAAGQENFLVFWQSMIDDLYNTDPTFKHHLQSHFYRTKSVSAFFTSCILPIASLSPKNVSLDGKKFTSGPMSLAAPDSKLHILQGLSDLEIALLIAAARLDIILDTDTCNFSMAYDEYSSLTSRHKIQISSTGVTALGAGAKVLGRDVALGAWERLADYELLVPTGIGGGGGGRDFGAGGRMWKVDVGLEEITGSIEGLSGVMAKWCREI